MIDWVSQGWIGCSRGERRRKIAIKCVGGKDRYPGHRLGRAADRHDAFEQGAIDVGETAYKVAMRDHQPCIGVGDHVFEQAPR